MGIAPFEKARNVLQGLSEEPPDVKVKVKGRDLKIKVEEPSVDILHLCHIVPLEVINLGKKDIESITQRLYSQKFQVRGQRTGPNFMALPTVSIEFALTEAGNSVLTASVLHKLAVNFGFFACVLHVTRHCTLTRLAQKFSACT